MEKQAENTITPAQKALTRKIWLNYYNNVLLDKGIITAEEYRKMKLKIDSKYPQKKF